MLVVLGLERAVIVQTGIFHGNDMTYDALMSADGERRGIALLREGRCRVKPSSPNRFGDLLHLFAIWAPDAALRQRILVDNPARRYGFLV